ncbi:hypothetical protein [Clostridium sp. AM42-4]|uniref:hypothetical protein n=1 Tax=Clostridium sp. AM42-4 TaxID=2292305 RepID=UPI000E4F55BE|nr:hypothetical protein [Clostridium sp. AM42-4]RHS91036.1 hypothetical protein DW922_01025 [Clostridium sp. AM42-4]
MVESKKDLQQRYGAVLEKINEPKRKEKNCSRTVELFFSFDIVNSSSYKDENYFGWPLVLTSLLTSIQRNVTKEIVSAQLWRVLGDEIIFFVTIRNIDEIYSTIDAVYNILVNFNLQLHSGHFFETLGNEDEKSEQTDEPDCVKKEKINFLAVHGSIAVQAAAWIAIVKNGDEEKIQPFDNIFKRYNINDNQQINEFLGQDIDTGFRIKKETQDRRLVVSVELAKLLSDRTAYLSRLNIVTYKSLKGVWRNRLYPIIWYHDKDVSSVSFEESFYYDEVTSSPLSKAYFDNRKGEGVDLPKDMFLDVHKALDKVIQDQNLKAKIELISQTINETENDEKSVENEFSSKLLEFHCAAVCCDVENRKILIAKRNDRKLYPGLWEFGCAKANIENSLSESIINDYKNDFGFDIKVVCEESRKDIEPVPIALYQVDKAEKIQKGVIVIARVIGNIDQLDATVMSRKKHKKYRWIAEEEIDDFQDKAIPDFKDTLKRVFSMWDKIFGD